MWVYVKETKEYIPFNEEKTDKVFYDGEKGWAIKQKDGKVYHVPQETYDKMLRELDSDAYWKMKQIEEAAQGLSEEETTQVKKLLKALRKKKNKDEEED